MKIALYIEDGMEQIVLTPEGATEKALLGKLHDGTREFSVKRGSFYACRGGWVRHGEDDDSTMLVMRRADAPAQTETGSGPPPFDLKLPPGFMGFEPHGS